METSTSNIAKKMILAMKSIDAVAKRGKNEKQNYNYVKAADVANEVRTALIEHGISFSYSIVEERQWEKPTANGGSMNYCALKVAVTFTDSDSKELQTSVIPGWGADSMEKAPYKAMTGALKYALRMNFLIPDESDPENEEKPSGYNSGTRQTYIRQTVSTPAQAIQKAKELVAKVPATAFPYGANDPLPPEMYQDNVARVHPASTLADDANAVAIEMENFIPLSDTRHEQIQNRLKDLITEKVCSRRNLMTFLDKQHEGKKALDVPAPKWEETMAKIETAVAGGELSVKALMRE